MHQVPRLSSVKQKSRIGSNRGFTLIELLVVIAIITLLAAILLPVFFTARENARQSSTITNMNLIQNALALYQLDNKSYPGVLFGYAVAGQPMSDYTAQNATLNEYGSLYPTYIKDWHTFTCSDNLVDNQTKIVSVNTNFLQNNGVLTQAPMNYYAMDAYDINPQLLAGKSNQYIQGNAPASFQYVVRYQTSWESYHPDPTATPPDTGAPDANYIRQLRWANPPSDTFVTCTTYHVPPANKIIVLYQSGSAVKVDESVGSSQGAFDDSKSCANTTACALTTANDSPANFWKFDSAH